MGQAEQFDHVLRCCGFPPLRAPTAPTGFGDVISRGGSVAGQNRRDLATIWQAEVVRIHEQLAQVLASELQFNRAIIKWIVEHILDHRSFAVEPIALA